MDLDLYNNVVSATSSAPLSPQGDGEYFEDDSQKNTDSLMLQEIDREGIMAQDFDFSEYAW